MNSLEKVLSSFRTLLRDLPSFLEAKEAFLFFIQAGVLLYLVFFLYKKTRGVQSRRAFAGIITLFPLILLLYLFFYFFELHLFRKIFDLFFPTFSVSLVVLFAPELRKFLVEIGSLEEARQRFSKIFENSIKLRPPKEIEKLATKVSEALKILSETSTGALIVFDKLWAEKLYVNPGYRIDAEISTELILNIFSQNSPLHDGAVVVIDYRLHSASVILPITENPEINPWQYGTRHRAAIGISEVNPRVFCLIVSEETGKISLANNGRLHKVAPKQDDLRKTIIDYLNQLT